MNTTELKQYISKIVDLELSIFENSKLKDKVSGLPFSLSKPTFDLVKPVAPEQPQKKQLCFT